MTRDRLGEQLARLCADTVVSARLATDPLRFVRRYADARDREIAAVFAAGFAYGRVDLFGPVLERLFAAMDRRGGPRAWVDGFDVDRDGTDVAGLVYRWNRGVDVILLARGLRRALGGGTLEAVFDGADAASALEAGVGALRDAVVAEAPGCGVPATRFAELPRGARYLLARPSDGSSCKRWNLFLRWLVRPDDGVDLGVWTRLRPTDLVIPLDTHVGRISRFLGLTDRATDNWTTAVAITDALRPYDPGDPVRFDFALAHLGISGGCTGGWDAAVCPACPLFDVCVEAC